MVIMSHSQQFLHWVKSCNNHNPHHYCDFFINDQKVGAIHKNNLPLFQAHPHVFIMDNDCVHLHPQFDNENNRTNVVNELVKHWHVWGRISGWREERYNVAIGFNHPPLMTLERSAASMFGIACYGVHLNGFTYKNNVLHLWVARRAKNKPTSPKKLDNLVAGGHAADKKVLETLIKESHEEANIPLSLARQAQAVGCIHYLLEQKNLLRNDTLFIYDLFLPENFMPHNNDGEVDAFYLWPISRVMDMVANGQQFKANVNLVLIDFFIRHGYLNPDDKNYPTLVKKLHRR